jgi:hypothetical protein
MTVTRSELLEVVYRFYPRNVLEYDPAYAASEEHRRLVDAARRAAADYPTWKEMIRRLGAQYSLQNECTHLLAGGVDPGYSARIWLTAKRALSLHVSVLGPYYGIHRSGAPDEEPVVRDIAREIGHVSGLPPHPSGARERGGPGRRSRRRPAWRGDDLRLPLLHRLDLGA